MTDRVLKVRWVLVDGDNKILLDQGTEMQFLESELAAQEVKDADDVKKALDLCKDDPTVKRMMDRNYGRGRVVQDITKAVGIVIGRHLERAARKHLGMSE